MKRWHIALVLVVLLGAFLIARSRHRGSEGEEFFETVSVQRGDLQDVQRETGLLESRDATPVRSGAQGRLEWVIRDGEWVEPGDKLFIINVDDALIRVTQTRTEVLGYQQELSLERMRRRHAERVENQKVDAAQRALDLAIIRHRILSTEPQGGRRLIELHDMLLPLEEETAELRTRYEATQDAYQEAQDAYLECLDSVQEKKDGIVYHQTKADEYRVRLQTGEEDATGATRKEIADAETGLTEAESAMEELRTDLPVLEQELDKIRKVRDEAQTPRDRLHAELAERERAQKELYIQLEIEKRAVNRVQLELDLEMAALREAEAERKQMDARSAFDSGAISQSQLEKLEDDLKIIRNDLRILNEKLAIARRPEPEEVLTEARLQMEQASVSAEKARDLRDRALRMMDQRIQVLEARIAKGSYDIERSMRAFPEVLEFSVAFLKEEMAALDESPEDVARRAEIETSLVQLEADLVAATQNPPNIATSPFAGVVHLMKRWRRPVQTGDSIADDVVVVQLFPGTNLEVRAFLNEADFGTITEGNAVAVIVPALEHRHFAGTVTHASRVGRDKFEGRSEGAWAGVTQFELRVRLDEVDEDLRPGMTAILECVVGQKRDVLFLPLEAVQKTERGYHCLRLKRGNPVEHPISGRRFSNAAFIIDNGLAEGDTVVIRRKRSS